MGRDQPAGPVPGRFLPRAEKAARIDVGEHPVGAAPGVRVRRGQYPARVGEQGGGGDAHGVHPVEAAQTAAVHAHHPTPGKPAAGRGREDLPADPGRPGYGGEDDLTGESGRPCDGQCRGAEHEPGNRAAVGAAFDRSGGQRPWTSGTPDVAERAVAERAVAVGPTGRTGQLRFPAQEGRPGGEQFSEPDGVVSGADHQHVRCLAQRVDDCCRHFQDKICAGRSDASLQSTAGAGLVVDERDECADGTGQGGQVTEPASNSYVQ